MKTSYNLYEYENDLHGKGYKFIAGCDEAGRGPLYGPVVAACCVLPLDFKLEGLTDSKQLTEKRREKYIDCSMVDCDLYRILEGDIDAVPYYVGEYMREYSWAETRNAQLSSIFNSR